MKHTKRILSLLLAVAMMVGLLPLSALRVSAASESIWVGGVEMVSGDYLAVGASATQTIQPSGGYAHFENGVLTLRNYEYEGVGYKYSAHCAVIYAEIDLKIVLEGENSLIQTADYSECIYVEKADLTLAENGNGSIHTTVPGDGINVNGGDVTINGGTITIDAGWSGIDASNVTINGGTVIIDAGSFGIDASNGDITIEGGTITIDAGGYGIDASNVMINGGAVTIDANVGIGTPYGDVTIDGGTVTIDAGVYGISGANDVTIEDGTVAIESDNTGIYGNNSVTINDGTVTIESGNTGTGDNNGVRPISFGIITELGDVVINSGTVTIDADMYGIAAGFGYTVNDDGSLTANSGNLTVNGGNVTVRSLTTEDDNGRQAIYFEDGVLTVADGLTIKASTEPDGIPGEYVAENHDTYDLIVIETYSYPVWVGGVEMASGDYLAVGASAPQGTKPSGGYAYYNNGILTLHNYEYEGMGYEYFTYSDYYAVIYAETDLKIVLEGENTLTQTADNSECIYVSRTDLILDESGDGSLYITSSRDGIYILYGDVTINGGTITIDAGSSGVYTPGGAVTINGGKVNIDAGWGGIDVSYGGAVTINGGKVNIDADKNGILASNGCITINGGEVIIGAEGGSGIEADDVTINAGMVTIDAGGDGILAPNGSVTINSSSVTVRSWNTESDDYYHAIVCYHGFTVADGLVVRASTEPDGALGKYMVADYDTYDLIVIEIGDEEPDIDYPYTVQVGGVEMESGDYLAVGASVTQEAKPSDGYAYFADGVLTLHNYEYEGKGYKYDTYMDFYAAIYAKTDLKIVLEGENTLTQTANNSAGIYVNGGSLVLDENGDGSLNLTAFSYGIYSEYSGVTIEGGIVTIGADERGIYSWKGSVTINDGTVFIEAGRSGITAAYSYITINGGTVIIDAGTDGIYASSGPGAVHMGSVTINGGNITVRSQNTDDDYFWAINSCGFFVTDERLTIKASTEPDGTPGAYVTANHDGYDLIVIGDGSSITVTDIGDVNYTVSGNIVTIAQEAVGKVGYWDGSKYIAITATAKGDGTYFFTAPAGVIQVLLAVKGDANGDGNISLADSTKAKAAYNKKTTLTAEALFALDTNGDGAITLADSTKIKATYNKKTTLSW